MILITDNPKFADKFFRTKPAWQSIYLTAISDEIMPLAERLLKNETIYIARYSSRHLWQYMFLVEYAFESQFDVLTEFSKASISIPRNTMCIAGSGKNFHGFKDRGWVSEMGNLHISAYFKPSIEIRNFGAAFTLLPAVSALEAIDSLNNFSETASVKWVNDIMVGSAKVGGILAYSQASGTIITDVVIGVGLNVEKKPVLEPTPFVPEVGSLIDYAISKRECTRVNVLDELLRALDRNYKKVTQGDYKDLLNSYTTRSTIIGREVRIMADEPGDTAKEIARGVVSAIGDNLEIRLEGRDEPLSKGRLIILPK